VGDEPINALQDTYCDASTRPTRILGNTQNDPLLPTYGQNLDLPNRLKQVAQTRGQRPAANQHEKAVYATTCFGEPL
jgi:hypothetical protein